MESSPELEPDLMTATIIDGVMIGVEYTTDSGVHGYTDDNGSYSFRDGDTITFNIGGVTLGSVTSEEALSGQTFLQDIAGVERTNLNDEYVENMATFVQSIDSDSSANILITEATRDSLVDANIDLRTASEEDVQALVESVGATYVEEEQAMAHVQDMLEEYAGIDESAFEEHTDDSLLHATLTTAGVEGITYTTSSGEEGVTGVDGSFTYAEGDTITFKDSDGNIIAGVESADIGSDNSITYEELLAMNESVTESAEEVLAIEEPEESIDEITPSGEIEEIEEVLATEEVTEVIEAIAEPEENIDEITLSEEVAEESTEDSSQENVENNEEDTVEEAGEFELLMVEDDFSIDLSVVEEQTLSTESTQENIDDTSIEIEDVLQTEEENIIQVETENSLTEASEEVEAEWTLGDFETDAESGIGSTESTNTIDDGVDLGVDISSEVIIDQS